MNSVAWTTRFESPLAEVLVEFIRMKRACGYRFREQERELRRLDCLLVRRGLTQPSFLRDVVEEWVARRPHESERTHHCRIRLTRAVTEFAARQGLIAYVPSRPARQVSAQHFMPRVFTFNEVARLFTTADALVASARRSRFRGIILPVALRVLYGCGLRIGELQRLRAEHVDLERGILLILDTKFRKDRLVPVADRLRDRLLAYSAGLEPKAPHDFFFGKPGGGTYSHPAYYHAFRDTLRKAGIGHGGRGQGPRIHDMRHTFAVHRLVRWYRAGADLNAKFPVLAAYLGHKSLAGTQRYLRWTGELYPDIAARLDDWVGRALAEAK